ncbi:MAG: hypothetical protein ACYSO0_01610 [Planctomycetota bacterium]
MRVDPCDVRDKGTLWEEWEARSGRIEHACLTGRSDNRNGCPP